jgi:hypothetical protein
MNEGNSDLNSREEEENNTSRDMNSDEFLMKMYDRRVTDPQDQDRTIDQLRANHNSKLEVVEESREIVSGEKSDYSYLY